MKYFEKGRKWREQERVCEWKKKETVIMVHGGKYDAQTVKIFIKSNDAKWGNTSKTGKEGEESRRGL